MLLLRLGDIVSKVGVHLIAIFLELVLLPLLVLVEIFHHPLAVCVKRLGGKSICYKQQINE